MRPINLIAFLLALISVVYSDGGWQRSLTDDDLLRSFETGYSYVDRLDQIESELLANEVYIGENSPFYKMAQFKRAAPKSREISRQALQMLETTRSLKERLGLSSHELMSLRSTSDFTVINSTCPATPTCYSSKYRTYDGSCNNLVNPLLGQSYTTFRRVLPANYSDGVQTPRLSTTGSQLSSARLISMTVFGGGSRSVSNTLAVMQFGQFINHDMESTGQFAFANGTSIMCCNSSDGLLNAASIHPACMAIEVPSTDLFYVKKHINRTCMNFVRSVAGLRNNCSLGYADQLNQNSHWLDASTVYGSDNITTASVRSFSSGLLLTSTDSSGRQLLPVSSGCTNNACFYAGDSRATEQPQLTVMHTLWVREHNRIAKQLAVLNPTWTDEILFQEARRILVAELQHITYTEWLPVLLNSTYITKYDLSSSAPNFYTGYSADLTDGPVTNEFATAAFRMGHSMVQGLIQLYDENGALLSSSYNMSTYFNDPSLIVTQSNFFDAAIRSLLVQPLDAADRQVNDELWQLLFKGNLSFGFDIVSLNIQRGRDHGLPGYNFYRQLCGLSKLTDFSDLISNGVASQIPTLMAQVYGSVDDIDLYVGGLTEGLSRGGNLGPTFSCIIAENFAQLKKSDRFFYENSGQRHSFTSDELTEIRKASMARIFCDNSDGTISSIQPKAFLPANGTNVAVSCASIASLDLSLWKDEVL